MTAGALRWIETEPINGAHTWILCRDGQPVSGEEIDDGDFIGDD